MDANMKKRNELLAKTVIKGLESRNMSGYYAKDKETALKQVIFRFMMDFLFLPLIWERWADA